jgi:hypothetical protein
MALGFTLTLAGSFGFSPLTSADEGPVADTTYQSDGWSHRTTTTEYQSGGLETTTTTCPPKTTTTQATTTTVAETTTTVPKTTTTVPETTTVPKTTTTEATTTVPQTTTTVPVSVLPTTTVRVSSPPVHELAVTGNNSSLPLMGLGVSLFVFGLILFEIRAARAANA